MGRTPWHLWVMAPVALGFGGANAWDYLSTHGGGAGILTGVAYVAAFTADQTPPAWTVATWAVGVWVGVIGALLLLLKSRFASMAFGLSLAGSFATALCCVLLPDVSLPQLAAPEKLVVILGIPFVTFLLWRYARRMTRAGVLG